jgi:hypothetical protein
MESVGFKEWAVICEALGRGRQSIILRKGGIAEGREGFSFKHREFFLFPTWFHEQPDKVRELQGEIPDRNDKTIAIRYRATLEIARAVTSWNVAEALAPLHILQPAVVRERFNYDQAPGLHVAFVRAFRLKPVWIFPNDAKYGGCRSWVPLPNPPGEFKLEPVLSESEHAQRKQRFLEITGQSDL